MPRALDVLLPLPLAPLRWLAPYGAAEIARGEVVVVPWQGGVRAGLVTGTGDADASRALELKEAVARLTEATALPDATVDWILDEAARTVAPAGLVLASLSPSWTRLELDHRVRELDAAGGPPGSWHPAVRMDAARLALLREQGLLDETVDIRRPTRRVLVAARATPDTDETTMLAGAARAAQRTAIEALRAAGEVDSGAALARLAGVGESPVRTLVGKGLARYEDRVADPPEPSPSPSPEPWPDGVRVAREPRDAGWIEGGTAAARLAAVVASLRRDLQQGRSPVVLAPERRVAHDAAAWLADAGPVTLAQLDDEPLARRAWEQARAAGPPTIVVGTFPVLAAPLRAPGTLVVLDAGSESYKLRAGARTWIPTAARAWADRHGVPAVFLDPLAGPETRALAGPPGRSLPRPRVRWVLSDLARSHGWPLGDEAVRVVRQVQERARQALVLVPRRGFSAALGCRDCGSAVMCPNCDLALRWHARDGRLRCHQCGHDAAPPEVCPACGGIDLEAQRAAGSEWVLRALEGVAPELPRYRFDGDVRDELRPLYEGRPGILVGTSALLRLPPLPVVSLLLVTQVDGALHADDFRSEERVLRTLATLQEAAGERSPLGLVQTFAPEHPMLRSLAEGTPEAFGRAVDAMEDRRRRFGYPPFGRMARVQASARREADAWQALEQVRDRLRAAGADADEVLGPAAAPVARVRGRALAHLLLRTRDAERRRQLLADATSGSFRGVRLRVDVDPRDIGEVLE